MVYIVPLIMTAIKIDEKIIFSVTKERNVFPH